ncbi:MAG: hypothetical protein J6B45_04425 [Clostridia bacterium]|nr:hypothetical protein [Clostridia bacterium]
MKGLSKFLMSVAAVVGAMAAIIAVFYKITKKHLKINVEVMPDNIEDEYDVTTTVDVVNMNLPGEKDEEEEPEIEIAFEETSETENA